jgi:hypothetical protein
MDTDHDFDEAKKSRRLFTLTYVSHAAKCHLTPFIVKIVMICFTPCIICVPPVIAQFCALSQPWYDARVYGYES